MIKSIIFLICILLSTTTFAKKVKFSVDMSNETVSPNGIHIMGDFQTVAGFSGGDFNPGTTTMIQEGASAIYSVVVDIPAFHKYLYKFVNGDLSYEAEFVPNESRVGYNFDDNRWLFLDSLAADTFSVGAIIFAGNAPQGLKLVRSYVKISNISMNSAGIHVAGNNNTWTYDNNLLGNLDPDNLDIYEIIQFVTPGNYQFKYSNGFLAENIVGNCTNNNNRFANVQVDTLLSLVCYGNCDATCATNSIHTSSKSTDIQLFPNPTSNSSSLILNSGNFNVKITDVLGKVVLEKVNYSEHKLTIENLKSGVYVIQVTDNQNINSKSLKLIVQ